MKKTVLVLLALSLTIGSTQTFADTGEKCAAYIDRTAGTTTTYDSTGAGILTTDQAIRTGIAAAIESAEELSPVGKVFPFVSILLRGFKASPVEGPDEDLVGCLEEFDGRVETLEDYVLAQSASDALNSVLDDIQAEIYDQNNHYAHKEAYDDYDDISNDIAGTLSYFLSSDSEQTGSKYRAIKNDTIVMLLTAELLAFAHNFEFNAYCASEYGYRWSDTALNLLDYNHVSGNFALMDYNAQLDATLNGYNDTDLFNYNSYREQCELGRDIYSRFRSLRTSSGTLMSEALSDLGLTVGINSATNKLSVSVDTSASKLLDYRLSVIGSCSTGEKGPLFENGVLGFRVWAEAEDYGPAESTTYYVSTIAATAHINSRKSDMNDLCNGWRRGRISIATIEVEELLNGIKDTLEGLSIYDYVRPADEQAGRVLSFDTYKNGEINNDLTKNYVLKPVFTLNSDGDITDKYNHYQLSLWGDDKYLKTSPGEGVFSSNGGGGVDSHWGISKKWPGTKVKLKSVYTDECLIDSNGSFYTNACDSSSYRWYSENTTGKAKHALVYLHAAEHTGKCLKVSNGIMSEIVAEDCDENDANQRFILSSDNKLQVNGFCMQIPNGKAFQGNSLIANSCIPGIPNGFNQLWYMGDDGTIQAASTSNKDSSYLCLEANNSGSENIDITLETCDSSEPKQKMIRRSVKANEVKVGATGVIIEHIENGNCIGSCTSRFNIAKSAVDNSAVNITRSSDGDNLKHKSTSNPYLATGLGGWGTWYLDDSDKDGLYALRSYATGECLVMNSSSMTSESCSIDSETWYFH